MVKRETVIQHRSSRTPIFSMADPVSSEATVLDPAVSLNAAEPSSQAIVLDEGYQTGHIGKETLPRSSGKLIDT